LVRQLHEYIASSIQGTLSPLFNPEDLGTAARLLVQNPNAQANAYAARQHAWLLQASKSGRVIASLKLLIE
jgi:hypothetical protein